MNAPEVRFDPEKGRVAIETTLGGPRSWFVFDPQVGGYYTPGTRESIDRWLPYGDVDDGS